MDWASCSQAASSPDNAPCTVCAMADTGMPRTRPATPHSDEGARCVAHKGGVDAHYVGTARERSRDPCGQLLPAGLVGAIHLGHERAHHWRARRHLHHLDTGAMALADRLQLGAHALGDGVALFVAVLPVHQVHLQVTRLGIGPKVVLPDQAIER